MDIPRDSSSDDDRIAEELREAFGHDADAMRLQVGGPGRRLRGSSAQMGSAGATDELASGTCLGDFEILEQIGRGGMGVVFRARQRSLDREVALKVLPGYARRAPTAVERFRTEAHAAARLHHTNIVPIYAHGEDAGRFFYAMELVEGGSLHEAIRERTRILSPSNRSLAPVSRFARTGHSMQGPSARSADAPTAQSLHDPSSAGSATPPDIASGDVRDLRRTRRDFRHLARLIAEVADGLDHAHRAGVVHRDIKPQNLLVGDDDRLHITDFGLARLNDAPGVTITGEVLGTPAYLSPEQVNADHATIDHRTDIYSLGVTLYELLTLVRPFMAATRDQLVEAIKRREPRFPRAVDPQVPKDLETVCLKAMDKAASSRYATAGDMAEDLRRFADGRPILSRRAGPLIKMGKWARRHKAATAAITAVGLVIVLSAGLAVSVTRSRRSAAQAIIDDIYDRLVYLDYRRTNGALEALNEAEAMGGDAVSVGLLRGLTLMFGENAEEARQAAIDELTRVVDAAPKLAEARYLLACAYDRNHQKHKAADLVGSADEITPATAAAMFFRGLALHFTDPDEAIASYEDARQLHASAGDIFMQATLQLARAHNQRMYATRGIEDFRDAEDALEQLISFHVYGGYPHYLLSIARRLAAEIYAGSPGTRVESFKAAQYYEAALAAAHEGQAVDPDNPSPHSAEAFCLESMGRLQDAVAAQTRVIERAADNPDRRCEALHYRWRLHYWLGDHDAALADLDAQANCPKAEERFDDRVYPALVRAAQADHQGALSDAYAITDEADPAALDVIWTATTLRLLGESAAADHHLDKFAPDANLSAGAAEFQSPEWVQALLELVRGERSLEDLASPARTGEHAWRLTGEAEFHAAAMRLAAGDREAALRGFQRAVRSFDSESRYTYHARMICGLMRQDPGWPPWILGPSLDPDGPNRVKQ